MVLIGSDKFAAISTGREGNAAQLAIELRETSRSNAVWSLAFRCRKPGLRGRTSSVGTLAADGRVRELRVAPNPSYQRKRTAADSHQRFRTKRILGSGISRLRETYRKVHSEWLKAYFGVNSFAQEVFHSCEVSSDDLRRLLAKTLLIRILSNYQGAHLLGDSGHGNRG